MPGLPFFAHLGLSRSLGCFFGRLDNWPLGAAISEISIMSVTLAVCAFLLGIDRIKKLAR